MSEIDAEHSRSRRAPHWLFELLGAPYAEEDQRGSVKGTSFVVCDGILRFDTAPTERQEKTQAAFEFLWSGGERFRSAGALRTLKRFYQEMYGDVANAPWWEELADRPLVLDAGCGVGLAALQLLGERLGNTRYLGIDISSSVESAARRFEPTGIEAAFMQADLGALPLPEASADVILSQGVLHHTDDTRTALMSLVPILKPRGRILFYVYKRKGPIREFTDDLIRQELQQKSIEDGWRAMLSLTKFGKQLAELNVEMEIEEAIDLLDIPEGKVDLQRFFYYHVFKCFYHEDMTVEEMNHVNFDWYAPANAWRHTEEEVCGWCKEAGLEIERLCVSESGIGVIACRERW